jgi:hypothetical protein
MDRPIIFSAPMVRGLIREVEAPGTGKTNTRRMLYTLTKNIARAEFDQRYPPPLLDLQRPQHGTDEAWTLGHWQDTQVDDRLWVREGFAEHFGGRNLGEDDAIFYRATDPHEAGPWHPSIHMPRRLSRLTLTVTGVKVERLNDITEADALAEGVVWFQPLGGFHVPGVLHPDKEFPILLRPTAREMFAALWDVIHGSGAWLANPWVVAVAFRPALRNIDAKEAA